MDINFQTQVALRALNTMQLSANTALFCTWHQEAQLPEILAEAHRQPETIWIGGGSNTLFLRDVAGLVVHIQTRGIQVVNEDAQSVLVRVAAGENWHHFVVYAIKKGWHGIENLALIPGTVGAAPVQNIGAYGVEVQTVIDGVQVVDTQNGKTFTLSQQECDFAYRHSIFKTQAHWLIASVDFRLSKTFQANLSYADLAQRLSGSLKVDAHAVFETVCAIRRQKLPDWREKGNVGSFFHNPLLSSEKIALFLQQYPHAPHHHLADGTSKVAAAWLIDQAGLKGAKIGDAMVDLKQPLVLVNCAHATAQDIMALRDKIQQTVLDKFGILLQTEPRMVE